MPVTPYQSRNSLIDFNVYKPNFIGRPVEQLSKMVAQQSANNKQIVDKTSALDLALSNLDVNPNDEGARDIITKQRDALNNDIHSITQAGDYTLAEARANKMARNFLTNKGIKTAVANQAAYNKRLDEADKLYYAGKISDNEYKYLRNQPTPNTDFNNEINNYNSFKGVDPVLKYNYGKDFQQYVNNFVPDVTLTPTGDIIRTITGMDGKPILDENGKPIQQVIGYGSEEFSRYNIERMTEGINNLAKSNPDMYNYLVREAYHELGRTPTEKELNTYIANKAMPYIEEKKGITYKNNEHRFSKPYTIGGYSNNQSNKINPYGNIPYVSGNFEGYNGKINDSVHEVATILYDDIQNSKNANNNMKNAVGKFAPTIKDTNPKVDFNNIEKTFTPEQKIAYNNLNTYSNNKYHKLFKELSSDEQDKVLKDFENIANSTNIYENLAGIQYADDLSQKLYESGYRTKSQKAKELFGTDILKPSAGHYGSSGTLNQGKLYNLETGEEYDGNFMTMLNDGKVKVLNGDKDEVVLGKNGDKNYNLPIKVMADINNSNSLTQRTNDYTYSQGYIIQIDGHEFVWSPKNGINRKKVLNNVVYNALNFNKNVELSAIQKPLGIDVSNIKFKGDDLLANTKIKIYKDPNDVYTSGKSAGQPKIKIVAKPIYMYWDKKTNKFKPAVDVTAQEKIQEILNNTINNINK